MKTILPERVSPTGTISIVSHGHGALLGTLLDDLCRQHDIASWLVIVTLNIPEPFDETAFPGLRITVLRNQAPLGFGSNHNAAARHAAGAVLAIVNPDIRVPDRGTLRRLAEMDWTSQSPLRSPIVIGPDGSREDSVRSNLSPLNLLRRVTRRTAGWEATPDGSAFFWLAGMFLVAPIEAFRALGGFDERYRLYCEDYDLSARWRLAGYAVELVPDLEVVHDARRDSHRSFRHMRWHLSSLARVWTSPPFWRIAAGTLRRRYHGRSA